MPVVIKKYNIPIYHGKLIVIVCEDFYEAILKARMKNLFDGDDQINDCVSSAMFTVKASLSSHKDWKVAIFARPSSEPDEIAHEAVHACSFLFMERGLTPSFDNDEPMAYMVGWIVDRVYDAIQKYHSFAGL